MIPTTYIGDLEPSSSVLSDVIHGATLGLKGFFRNLLSPGIRKHYSSFLFSNVLPTSLVLYGLAFIACCVFFPITLGLLILKPGVILGLFTLIPLWSYELSKRRHPIQPYLLFAEGMKPLDPALSEDMIRKEHPTEHRHRSITQVVGYSISSMFSKFTLLSSFVFFFSFVPLLGSIVTAIGQTYLVAQSFASGMLEVFTKDYLGLDESEREEMRKRHRWVMFGFAYPFTLLTAIPLVGPLFLGIVQASTADFVHDYLQKKENLRASTTSSSS